MNGGTVPCVLLAVLSLASCGGNEQRSRKDNAAAVTRRLESEIGRRAGGVAQCVREAENRYECIVTKGSVRQALKVTCDADGGQCLYRSEGLPAIRNENAQDTTVGPETQKAYDECVEATRDAEQCQSLLP